MLDIKNIKIEWKTVCDQKLNLDSKEIKYAGTFWSPSYAVSIVFIQGIHHDRSMIIF